MPAKRLPIVARDFRGALLYLTRFERGSLLFCWSSDSSMAHVFASDARALGVARIAASEYKAQCHVIDGAQCIIVPREAAQPDAEPTGKATARDFSAKRRVTAAVREETAHCPAHVAYSDGCAHCLSVHMERSSDANDNDKARARGLRAMNRRRS